MVHPAGSASIAVDPLDLCDVVTVQSMHDTSCVLAFIVGLLRLGVLNDFRSHTLSVFQDVSLNDLSDSNSQYGKRNVPELRVNSIIISLPHKLDSSVTINCDETHNAMMVVESIAGDLCP